MIQLPEFELYLFDLDDTLINTRQAYHDAQKSAVRRVFPHLGGEELEKHLRDLQWLCRLFGSGQPRNYFAAFAADLSASITLPAETVESLLKIYDDNFHRNLTACPGSTAFLQQLTGHKRPLALVSNGKTATQLHKLRLTGLERFFPASCCFISEMVLPDQQKPSSHLVEMACSTFGIAPARSVFFGNTAADMVAGNLAGAATVLCSPEPEPPAGVPGIARPDYRIHSWL